MGLQIANEPAADQVLDEHPFAVVAGMMLDQSIR
ncbi:HhH-GPD family protein [Cellulomonas gilvus ATCC 13127]|uniref:HhH-GPD family protein n=1 Tax=Cellulomonas gilvus (strain ATCC 13127 / NRRL B-14078) TaxID=593907 RepID=F8A089_CELGA|nr:HhH-GPD family protein [Cellulomonas gilvus ATCC 13127]